VEARDAQIAALKVVIGSAGQETTDLFFVATEIVEVSWTDGAFHGQALWVRLGPTGAVDSVTAVQATYLALGERELLSADEPRDLYESFSLPPGEH
jgi:hypothetical protein